MAVSNARILYRSWADDASLTATSEAGNMTVDRLQDPLLGRRWRSTSTADQVITIDLGEDRAVSAICLYSHNLSFDATVRLEAADDAAFTAPLVFDETWDAVLPTHGLGEGALGMDGLGGYDADGWEIPYVLQWIDRTIARYWRVTLSDSTNADGYLQIGRLLLGDYLTTEVNIDWGLESGWRTSRRQRRTRSGALRADSRPSYRVARLSWSWLDEIEGAEMHELQRLRGRSGDLLLSVYPGADDTTETLTTLLGMLTEWSPIRRPNVAQRGMSATFEESR
jgi:hypothetical protein